MFFLLCSCEGAQSGGFHFQVNDGVNFAPRQIFSTTARSLVLSLQNNHLLEVYPGWPRLFSVNILQLLMFLLSFLLSHWVFWTFKGSVTPLSELHLLAATNQDRDLQRNQSVVFTVTVAPKLGRLVQRLSDNSTQNVSTFTQSMVGLRLVPRLLFFAAEGEPLSLLVLCQVNEGAILYDQKMPESVGWSAEDSFSFTVSSPPAFLPPHTFTILISYQANEHRSGPHPKSRLLSNEGAVQL